ncbi:hypothetical protein [Kitasatospora paranensis]|uniref:Uncharacterized protein n=1 Tax=Kitasatospora paranensis TaxID=258053 RepID=A0ABW2G0N3_9ACTN
MSMFTAVEKTAQEAERQLARGEWQPIPGDVDLARQTAAALEQAVGPAEKRDAMLRIERLESLREALAAMALTVARTHGQLAWFLAQCTSDLTPVLHWRALPAPQGQAFGTVLPTPDDMTDAEHAVRRLNGMLARIATTPDHKP